MFKLKNRKRFTFFIMILLFVALILILSSCGLSQDKELTNEEIKEKLIKKFKEKNIVADNVKVVLIKKIDNQYYAIFNYNVIYGNYESLVAFNIKQKDIIINPLGGGVCRTSPDDKISISSTSYESNSPATKWMFVYGTVFDPKIAKIKVVFTDDREVVTEVDWQSDYGGYLVYRENFVKGFKRIEALDKNLKVVYKEGI
ncbi:hypothetical protein ciss_12380 [Carboxydothermus islandicus]|uniref:Lipoprotein n=1 Tax=Carboxydothermus islandicus TaxID=661089 RepID=A0A1L8D282_9THEO|nr:hypothetical protein [Carboxydothermus islandicus]GAV25305.1 hypothetical protein ciss_12380 [Carboxydothermus islandicus]